MSQATFLNRQALYLRPDPARVIVRPFKPATEPRDLNPTDKTRANHIVERVLELDSNAAASQLADVLDNFQGRHRNLLETFELRADEMEEAFAAHCSFSRVQRQLIGAYFMNEYSFEASALFNPSIVPHPDQSATAAGSLRFVLSLRAVGEGHVSSLTFRSGTIAADGSISIDPTARLASSPRIRRLGPGPIGEKSRLSSSWIRTSANASSFPSRIRSRTASRTPASSNSPMPAGRPITRPTLRTTARAIRSELIETRDFLSFRMSPLQGAAARNKGMALFPRRIDGKYAMIARQDNENLYLIYSDDLYRWDGGEPILKPQFPWEFVQIGNCGSPIELEEGWLLLTHGVGPVRKYSIGAALLDKRDPSKVLARSSEPLLRPEPSEREGYVPNVVYTCGAMAHNDLLILPYAVSDTFSNFATISISALLKLLS